MRRDGGGFDVVVVVVLMVSRQLNLIYKILGVWLTSSPWWGNPFFLVGGHSASQLAEDRKAPDKL